METVSILPVCDRPGRTALRAALASGIALAMLAALMGSSDAAPWRSRYYYAPSYPAVKKQRLYRRSLNRQAPSKASPEREGFVDMPKDGVLQIGISIASQRVTVFRDGKRIVQGPISSGTASHPTPMGVFSVIEKDRHHRSNIYSNAPMPFMQRITWSGVAMHEGVLPGYPASHGCIRLPRDFAARLWPTTRMGVRVIVSRHEIAPVEFEHPSLFLPKPKPAEPPMAMLDDGGKPGLRVHLAQAGESVRDAGGIDLTRSASEPAKPAAPAAVAETDKPAAVMPVEERKPVDAAMAAESKPRDDGSAAEKPAAVAEDDAVKATGTVVPPPPQEAVVPPAELRKAVEIPAVSEPAAAAPAAAVAEPKAAEAAPPAELAVKPAADGAEAPKLPAPKYKKAEQPPKRNGQVAVFVSRKEKKIFVRQGFSPLFDMPIEIEDVGRPLGTHVLTALGPNETGGMRWNLVTVTDPIKGEHREPRRKKNAKGQPNPVVAAVPPTTAKEALDRIQMPKEAVDRIGELLVRGSSLVISDQGISHETGRGTEFIVLTH